MVDGKWSFYIIFNKNSTYAGVSPDPVRRLRQHNGEIKGGAKYTTSKGEGWKHFCLVSGFQDKIQAMHQRRTDITNKIVTIRKHRKILRKKGIIE